MNGLIIGTLVCLGVSIVFLAGSWGMAVASIGSSMWFWYWVMSGTLFVPGVSLFISFVIGLYRLQEKAEEELKLRVQERVAKLSVVKTDGKRSQ